MATLFTKIIEGEIPGRFVWRDDRAAAFLTIAPIRPGHVLVVPIEEVDHWVDLDADLAAHLTEVARQVGRAQMTAFAPTRIGLIVAGLEVPHCHLHLIPIDAESDLSFAKADHDPSPAALDDAAERLRAALRDQGHAEVVAGAAG
jgi:histidine triad (HIT) family protein